MKKSISLLAVGFAILASQSFAQTKTVGATGADFTTIAAALAFFQPTDPDGVTPNVINIIDSGVYDEVVTITAPMTFQGTGSSRPIIAARNNTTAGTDGNDGFCVQLAAAGTVTLKNLIIIPSAVSVPVDDLLNSGGANTTMTMDTVALVPNNGANGPLTLTGLSAVSLTGAVFPGDDGATLKGAGSTYTLKNVVISHMRAAGTAHDGLVITAGSNYFIQDGCVFSFNQRVGIQANGLTAFSIDGTAGARVVVTGNRGFAGIWFAGPQTTTRDVKGCNVYNNLGEESSVAGKSWGMENQSIGCTTNISDCIFTGNTGQGILMGDTGSSAATFVTNVTRVSIANNGFQAIQSPVAAAASGATNTINITDSILAGNNGAGFGGSAANVIENDNTGTITIDHSAIVTAGAYALAATPTAGTGPFVTTNDINSDPGFQNTTSPGTTGFFKVTNAAYLTAATASAPLKGGGTNNTVVSDWAVF